MQKTFDVTEIKNQNYRTLSHFCMDSCPLKHTSYEWDDDEKATVLRYKCNFNSDTCPMKKLIDHLNNEWKDRITPKCVDCEYFKGTTIDKYNCYDDDLGEEIPDCPYNNEYSGHSVFSGRCNHCKEKIE